MAQQAKRKVSVSLDADLVRQMEDEGVNVSGLVNEALRAELGRRRRHRALGELLDRLEAEDGPLDTPEDEEEIRRYMRILGGHHVDRESEDQGRSAA